jgi:hypothetical protein
VEEFMPRNIAAEKRSGARYPISLPIQAEWDDDGGEHIIEKGMMENVSPEGTLVHLQRLLPEVGSRVRLEVFDEEERPTLKVTAEVLRLERNAAHPQAALQLLEFPPDWRKKVWEPAAPLIAEPKPYKNRPAPGSTESETVH